jgi:hypothetical protein
MEKRRTSELTLRLELTQGKRLVAVLESIPRDNDLVEVLAMLEQRVNRRRKDLERSKDGAGEEALGVAFRERRSVPDRRRTSDRRGAIGLTGTRYGS